jgi:hypothetical protein
MFYSKLVQYLKYLNAYSCRIIFKKTIKVLHLKYSLHCLKGACTFV